MKSIFNTTNYYVLQAQLYTYVYAKFG